MGVMNSCFIPRRGSELGMRQSTPKEKGHRRNLSATFNLSVIGNASTENCMVNINTASEEELMTLPGVSRVVAKNIIDYRNHIGGFRRVEDLALATGVGAAKLAQMRSEIYVESSAPGEKEANEENPSPQQGKAPGSHSAVCINTANIFSLLKVKGVGMTIAKNIVAHREKHGKYEVLDDLLKVKGIGHNNLETMRPYLTVEDKHQDASKSDRSNNHRYTNGKTGKSEREQTHSAHEPICQSASSLENLLEVLGPLARAPERPKMDKVELKYKNHSVLRLASWNLEKFSLDKARNPGVKDVICMTVLENRFGLVAVQELQDMDALHEICQELNMPTLPNVKKWAGNRGNWACVVSETTSCSNNQFDQDKEYQGFLYDKSQNIELVKSCSLLSTARQEMIRDPYLGIFKIKEGLSFALVNIHSKAGGAVSGEMKQYGDKVNDLVSLIEKEVTDVQDIIILGDFHCSPDSKVTDDLHIEGYSSCISPAAASSEVHENSSAGCVTYGNIWISQEAHNIYTGVSGVVTDGLSSSWIPHGWLWGGRVSKDCPIYVQLYTSKDLNTDNTRSDAP